MRTEHQASSVPTRAEDIIRNTVKAKLARDELVLSMVVRLVRSVEIARIAKTSGFDSLYVDLEHASFSLDTTSQICMAAFSIGLTPLVRVPAGRPEYVGRALDGGALGVIAPHVGSAAEAEEVVRSARFPPRGVRSFAGPLPHGHYLSLPVAEANAALDAATLVAVMIETRDAVDRVAEIAAVDGVDLLLIGTNDLCIDAGIPGTLDHPIVLEAYERTIAACRVNGKHAGIGGLGSRPDLIAYLVKAGARYVSVGSDLSFLLEAAAKYERLAFEPELLVGR